MASKFHLSKHMEQNIQSRYATKDLYNLGSSAIN
jgi:hypothetical protein